MKIGICKLCDEEKELCNSHILPKFILKIIKDNQQHLFNIFPDYENITQDGEKKYLFCSDCEQLLGKNENRIARNFHLDIKKNIDAYKFYNENFIYFCFSILFRYSFSELNKINLGVFKEQLRLALLKNDLEELYKFPLVIFCIENDWKEFLQDEDIFKIVMLPTLKKVDNKHCYIMSFLGVYLYVFISKNVPQEFLKEAIESKYHRFKSINLSKIINLKKFKAFK